jgi:hypothetical protein
MADSARLYASGSMHSGPSVIEIGLCGFHLRTGYNGHDVFIGIAPASRAIRADVAVMKVDLADVKSMQLRLREDFNRFEGGLLRFERIESVTQLRLDRIETRLNFSDAE